MEDLGRRQPFTRETFDPFPCRDVLLAAPPERALPEVDNIEAERTEHANVGGHGVVVELKPWTTWPSHCPCRDGGSCMRFRRPSLISFSFARMRSPRLLRFKRKPPLRDLPQMKMKPRNLKVSGLLKPRRSRLAAAKRPNSIRRVLSGWSVNANAASLSRIASRKRRASVSDSKPKIALVGVAYDDHVALGFAPSPALGPQIEDVVQVDVGEQRRDGRSLPRSPLRNLDLSVFENARPKPFPGSGGERACRRCDVREGPGEPFFAHRVEELRNVGVDNVIHLPGVNGRRQGVEPRRALPAPAGIRS